MSTENRPIEFRSGELTLVGDEFPATGDERGIVLFLHGGGQTRHSWDRAAGKLAAGGWRCVTVDSRGHGDSSWDPDGAYSADAMVPDVQAIVAQLGALPVIIGASMGGTVAIIGQGNHAPLARALVLVDIVPRPDRRGIDRIKEFMASAPDGFASLEEAADAIAGYSNRPGRKRNLDGVRKNVRLHADGRWHWHWDPKFMRITDEPSRAIMPERLLAAAAAITVPTLIIRGLASDIVTEESAIELRDLIPGSILQVAKAGHMVAGDDNGVFVDHVLGFLNAL